MVVVDLLDAKRVGSERRYGALIRGLREAGHEVHLFARRWDPAAAEGLTCHRLPAGGPAALRPLGFALAALAVVRRWRQRLDLVHSHARCLGDDLTSPGGSAHRAYLAALGRGEPWLRARARAWHPYHRAVLAVERAQFARVRRIVVNSEWSRRRLLEAYPWAAPRAVVVWNGVDGEWFSPAVRGELRAAMRASLGLAPADLAFLFVGAGDRRKGLLELLEAFAGLPARGPRLVVVGHQDAREAARVGRAIERWRLAERVRLVGFTPDPRPYYAAADAFVLPTKFDPFSNATAEALACGLPVITTTSNGVSELMSDGREGFVVPDPWDVAALRAALARMLDADREAMGQAGRALAETLTWRRHVAAMLGIYAGLLEGGR